MKIFSYTILVLSLFIIPTLSTWKCGAQQPLIKSQAITPIERLKFAIFLEERDINAAYNQLKSIENNVYEKLRSLRNEIAKRHLYSEFLPEFDIFIAGLPAQKKPITKIRHFVDNMIAAIREKHPQDIIFVSDPTGQAIETLRKEINKLYETYDKFKESRIHLEKLEKDLEQEQNKPSKKFKEEL